MVRTVDLPALSGVAPTELVEPRLMAHHAAQWASRAARAVLEAKADDSHSSLCWDPRHGALMSQNLAVDGRAARIGVRLRDLTLICAGGGRTLSQFPLDGQTNSAAAAWVAEQLSGLGQDPSKLNDTLPYDLPTQPGAGGGAVAQSEGLAELALWFATADQVLAAIAGKFSGLRPGPSPVRCWPHHFDIATLIELDADGGENARSAGVGMTPGDDSRGQPYFYAAPWPYPEVADLRSLPPPAFWNTEGWVGAVIDGLAVVKIPTAGDQMEMLTTTATNAVEACLAILNG